MKPFKPTILRHPKTGTQGVACPRPSSGSVAVLLTQPGASSAGHALSEAIFLSSVLRMARLGAFQHKPSLGSKSEKGANAWGRYFPASFRVDKYKMIWYKSIFSQPGWIIPHVSSCRWWIQQPLQVVCYSIFESALVLSLPATGGCYKLWRLHSRFIKSTHITDGPEHESE